MAPLIVHFAISFFSTLLIMQKLRFGYKFAAIQSRTAVSDNFKLAIAVAVASLGANSDQALAAAVGSWIEVPGLLTLVYVIKLTRQKRNWRD